MFVLAASIMNPVTDLVCTLVPINPIWKLQMKSRQKLAVASLFGLGLFINIAGTLRTCLFYEYMSIANIDLTWVNYLSWISMGVG